MLRLGLQMVAAPPPPITDDWILISPLRPQQQLYTFEIKKRRKKKSTMYNLFVRSKP